MPLDPAGRRSCPLRRVHAYAPWNGVHDARHHGGGCGQGRLLARPVAAADALGLGDDVLELLARPGRQAAREPRHLLGQVLDDLLRTLLDGPLRTVGVRRLRRRGLRAHAALPAAPSEASPRPSVPAAPSLCALTPLAIPRAAAVTTSLAFSAPATPYTAPRRTNRRTRGDRATAVAATATATSESR